MSRLIPRINRFPLWLWVALSLVLYCVLALWFPLLPHYDRLPLSDVRSFAPSLAGGLGYGALICLLFAFFAMAYRRVCLADEKLGLGRLIGVSFLFSLPLLLVYPINANDLYRYLIRGRIQSVYGENPFSVAPDSFLQDPFLPLAGEWAGATSPYGPLWEMAASLITSSSGSSLLLGLLAFKLLGLLAFLGSAVLLWMIWFPPGGAVPGRQQNNTSGRVGKILLWAWNPALLLIFVVNGHNDALMIFCLLLGYYFVQRGNVELGTLLMLLGSLIKPIGLLALPFIFIAVWRGRPSLVSRLRFLAVTIFGGLFLAWLAFLPFGTPWELSQRLVQEAASGASFSPVTTLILISQSLDFNLTFSISTIARATTLLFLLFALWLGWLTWRGRSALPATADIFFAYLLQALNFRIWYAIWPFPWLLLDAGAAAPSQRALLRLHYGLWFLLTTQLSVILYGHIRIHLLDGSQLWAHILGMLFVFILPLLLTLASERRMDRRSAGQPIKP